MEKSKIYCENEEVLIKYSDNWIDSYKELYELLVPKIGKASTVQGEVIRICGKLEYEILNNGIINWDSDFELMVNALKRYLLTTGNLLSEEENKNIKSIISKIKRDTKSGLITLEVEDFNKLTEFCTKWILLNKKLIKLKEVSYDR